MMQYHNVHGTEQPEPMKIDEYSVWIAENICETENGWIYDLTQYEKDEYIKRMDEANQKAQADLEYLAMMTEVELE